MSYNFKKRFYEQFREEVQEIVADKSCWIFVSYDVSDVQRPMKLKDLAEVWWNLEKGRKKQRLHLQGYARFNAPKSRQQLQDQMPGFWALRRGTHEQAIRYCTKEDTRVSGPYHHVGTGVVPYLMSLDAIVEAPPPQAKKSKLRLGQPFIGPLQEGHVRPQSVPVESTAEDSAIVWEQLNEMF